MNPSENRGYLTTEQSNPRSVDLDVLSTDDLVKLFIDEDRKPQLALEGNVPRPGRRPTVANEFDIIAVSYTHLTLPTNREV